MRLFKISFLISVKLCSGFRLYHKPHITLRLFSEYRVVLFRSLLPYTTNARPLLVLNCSQMAEASSSALITAVYVELALYGKVCRASTSEGCTRESQVGPQAQAGATA